MPLHDVDRALDRDQLQLPVVKPGSGFDLLKGVRVLDFTTSVAGPFASMLLADLGADVIKVERRSEGDDSRAWGPPFLGGESLWFLAVNRNKRSLAIDYASEAGLAVVHGLARLADVVLVNQPAKVSAKLKVDYDTLRALRPDLIYVSITGFGLDGERADWPCYDLIAEGYSGVMDLTGEPDGPPQKIGAPAADMLAAQDAALATVSALFARSSGGRGRLVEVSLVNSMTRFLSCRIVPYLGSGELPRRAGGKDSVIAIYQAFDTADEPLTLALGNDNIWRRFWAAVGEPETAANPNYDSNAKRRMHRTSIAERIQGILDKHPRAHWLDLFRRHRIPAGPINRVDEMAVDPEMHRHLLVYQLQTERGLIPQVGTGFRLDGEANVARRPPPRLGEHTADVLANDLGYEPERLAELKTTGII